MDVDNSPASTGKFPADGRRSYMQKNMEEKELENVNV